jgi:hypothetical protein
MTRQTTIRQGEPQPSRRSARGRQPSKRLQVDWHQQQYEQREPIEINDELLTGHLLILVTLIFSVIYV